MFYSVGGFLFLQVVCSAISVVGGIALGFACYCSCFVVLSSSSIGAMSDFASRPPVVGFFIYMIHVESIE